MLAVLVLAIGLSSWVQYARTVRGSVMVEKSKDYVAAAQLIGLPAPKIMLGKDPTSSGWNLKAPSIPQTIPKMTLITVLSSTAFLVNQLSRAT